MNRTLMVKALIWVGLAVAGLHTMVGCAASGTSAPQRESCLDPGYTCVDGVRTACGLAPPAYCAECGCPSEFYCEDGVGCMPKHAVGESCKVDDHCNSNNCSRLADVCRVPYEAACTPENCDVCLVADGWSYCSHRCDGGCHGRQCVDNVCRPQCDIGSSAGCPGAKCEFAYDRLTLEYNRYCDCVSAGTCFQQEAPHPLGTDCVVDEHCESNLCDSPVIIDNVTRYSGLCSKPCTSTDDCGSGFACAAINPGRCLPTCKGACLIGTCVVLPTTEATTESVCWTRHPSGEPCAKPADCLSGNCVGGKCSPSAG